MNETRKHSHASRTGPDPVPPAESYLFMLTHKQVDEAVDI